MIPRSALMALIALAAASPAPADELLPRRVRRIVLHTLGGPAYDRPERRFVFFAPLETQALWKPGFGAHWTLWTDGTLWPRHPEPGEPRARTPPPGAAGGRAERERLAREAGPVYAHVYGHNSHTVGIELSHSGRSTEGLPEAQLRSLAFLLRTLLEMSGGRLTAAEVVGHKDLDRRPAYVLPSCERPGCPVFVDEAGQPFRRRVDPPESIFVQLRKEGLDVPRPPEADAELRRAEAISPGARPRVAVRVRTSGRALPWEAALATGAPIR